MMLAFFVVTRCVVKPRSVKFHATSLASPILFFKAIPANCKKPLYCRYMKEINVIFSIVKPTKMDFDGRTLYSMDEFHWR